MISDASEAAIDQIVANCDGDIRGALRALLLVNEKLEAELAQFYAAVGLDGMATRQQRAALDALVDASTDANGLNPGHRIFSSSCAGGRFVHRRAFADGRTGQLGVVDRLERPGAEPDVPADLEGDDGIAGHDIAFAGGAVADHPISALRRTQVPVAKMIAPASSTDFMARSCHAVGR